MVNNESYPDIGSKTLGTILEHRICTKRQFVHYAMLLAPSKQLCGSFPQPADLSKKMVPYSLCNYYSYTRNESVLPRVFIQITTQYLWTIFSFKISMDGRVEGPQFVPRYRHWPIKAMQLESKNPWILQHSLTLSECLITLEIPVLT